MREMTLCIGLHFLETSSDSMNQRTFVGSMMEINPLLFISVGVKKSHVNFV